MKRPPKIDGRLKAFAEGMGLENSPFGDRAWRLATSREPQRKAVKPCPGWWYMQQ
jgi:hypothetical protein